MSQIYKVNHIEGDTIKKIYIFSGNKTINKDTYLKDNNTPIFSEMEMKIISSEQIPVEIINDVEIHGDDTIGMIKKKIIIGSQLEVASSELYMFGITEKKLNPSVLYKQLTQNEQIQLTKPMICRILLNIVDNGCDTGETKATCDTLDRFDDENDISFDEFLNIIDWDSEYSLTIPIGLRLVGLKKQIPFVANPFNCETIDRFLMDHLPGIVTSQNTNLLFESGEICGNNIYFCTAEEVLQDAENKSLPQEKILELYFPILSQIEKVNNAQELEDKKQALIEQESKTLNAKFRRHNQQVDMFYDIYDYGQKTKPLSYIDNTPGVKSISVIIHPLFEIKFPLDILFKLIHSTKKIPMIKYNPGSKKENMYRLFTNGNIATNGKKIPYLYTFYNNKKSLILKLSKVLASQKKVSFYINVDYNNQLYDIICSFSEDGTIYIDLPGIKNNVRPLSLHEIEEIIKISVEKSITNKIKIFLEQSGYSYSQFTSLNDRNVEIQNIDWMAQINVPVKIDLKKYISCLSSIFTIEQGSLAKSSEVISMRYKRVSAYNQLNAEEAFILELRKQNIPIDQIIVQLQSNFKINEEEARRKVASWLSQIQQRADLYENKKERTIITNVGFPVFITRDPTTNTVTINIQTINNIHYLKFISIYIDSLLRMFIDVKNLGINKTTLNQLCKGKAVEYVVEEKDVQANDDKNVGERQEQTVEKNKIVFDDDEDEVDDFLDDIMDFDDDEDYEVDDDDIDFGDEIDFGDDIAIGDEIDFGDDISPTKEDVDINEIEIANEKLKKVSDKSTESTKSQENKQDSPSAQSEISEAEIDLTGLPLRGAKSIFMQNNLMKRGLMHRDPKIFIKKGKGRYSTACPSQYDKQPIILTDKEKKYIDEKDEEFGVQSYDESITYGTGDKKFHYICPRFWCLNDENGKQRSITLKEINEGKCGGWDALIPRGSKKVPKGKRIYEFTDQRFHRERYQMSDTDNILVYKPMYPGFQERTKHPDNLCIPCCFGRPTKLSQSAINAGWSVEEKGKKLFFKNSQGETVDKSKVPRQAYDGTNNTDYMYKPTGEGKEGPGPSFERDANGNIILDSIRGEPQLRELPASNRISTFKDCNEATVGDYDDEKEEEEEVDKKIAPTKMEEAPAWEIFPLRIGQLGYLPEAVQKLFNYNQRPQKGESSLRVKINKPVFLRKGMERSKYQSFLSCIADVYEQVSMENKRLTQKTISHTTEHTIEWVKNKIVEHLNLDNFIMFQNGTLVDVFYEKEDEEHVIKSDMSEYENDTIYKVMQEKNSKYLIKIITAFKNFTTYLKNDETVIDYEFLWDILCTPRDKEDDRLGGLFMNGLNLLILKSPTDDITSKIEIVCPTNHFSSEFFSKNKPTLILYEKENYYEPIYQYTRKSQGNKYIVDKLVDTNNAEKEAPQIARSLLVILTRLNTDCKPLPSMPEKYIFKMNKNAKDIFKLIQKTNKYTIEHQVLNLHTKTVGFIVTKNSNNQTFYVPTYPSSTLHQLPFILLDDPDIIKDYNDTVENLKELNKISKNEIPCNPIIKYVNDSVITGLLTETNQFIPVQPTPNIDSDETKGLALDGLIEIENNTGIHNFMKMNADIGLSDSIDLQRKEAVSSIKLESYMFNSFRNIARIVINKAENKPQKENIISILNNPTIPYVTKLNEINLILQNLMNNYVDFITYSTKPSRLLENISSCIGLDQEKCDAQETTCLYSTDDGICKLQVSRMNLISRSENNRDIYFTRLADQFIRYNKIRMFIFNPRQFLTFQKISYDLRDDEIILLENILYGDYFDDVVLQSKNKFIKDRNIYDMAEPINKVPYKSKFVFNNKIEIKEVNKCIIDNEEEQKLNINSYIRNHKLSGEFNLKELKYTFQCTWELPIMILKDFGIEVTIQDLRLFLIDTYRFYLENDLPKLTRIFKKERKLSFIDLLLGNISDIISLEEYYLTPFDLFSIFNYYNCPVIISSRTSILETVKKHISFVRQSQPDFVYVIFGGVWNTRTSDVKKRIPAYGIIERNDSMRLTPAYFGEFYETLSENPIISFNDYYKMVSIEKPKLKIKRFKAKKK